YNDYFEDAGAENEASVISSLGSPREIADNIKAELKGEAIPTSASAGDHAVTKYGQIVPAGEVKTEESAESARSQAAGGQSGSFGGAGGQGGQGGFGGFGGFGGAGGQGDFGGFGGAGGQGGFGGSFAGAGAAVKEMGRKLPLWAWIVLLIVLITVAPAIFGVLAGIFGAAVGVIAAWFSIIIAFGAAGFGLIVSGIVTSIVSIPCVTVEPIVMVLVLGVGLLLVSIGMLLMMLAVWMAGTATPKLIKWIGSFFKLCWKGIKALYGSLK
ncbi:MAG: hypothetical protein J5721_03460, partial [Lachnospiraceae bacterium]|nr:hypothetical protein [Lachnospiraceae bacterium]